ncbi:TauD/TfdA family dioxygenase [Aliisedimentitalea scapharcae]|uniref:TauD/TfdA family dioxygenase n=1 Tax=Aliisedimentitalea scapharcae TaxID=1524259 RepID=A0ABZ2XUU2_9RHOB
MHTTPLHPRFGLVFHDVNLSDVTADHLFPEIRQAFETHSALLFRGQDLSDAEHTRLGHLFGPLENRESMALGTDVAFEVSALSNRTAKGLREADDLRLLDLQANMLWHTDSTFLPIPSLVNIITAKVVPDTGGETEIASTRVAWAEMPEELKAQLRDAVIWHRLSHSRSRISEKLATLPRMTRWPDRPWRAVWPNPVTGEEALLIASHAFAIEGCGLAQGQALIDRAIAHCTQADYVYSHKWQVGDVLIWDERATMHRGRPWDYAQERSLKSLCCSATDADGVPSVRVV